MEQIGALGTSYKNVHLSLNTRGNNMSAALLNHYKTDIDWDLESINHTLNEATPETIARWAISQKLPTIVSSSFGELSAATLHLVSQLDSDIPVVWVDTGFTSPQTQEHAQTLTQRFNLDLRVFRPRLGPIEILNKFRTQDPTDLTVEEHSKYTETVKIEPFDRAISQLLPKIWITGIRADETEHRRKLAPVSWDRRGILKIAPFFHSTVEDLDAYLKIHGLPKNQHYQDPTKLGEHLECGLHK